METKITKHKFSYGSNSYFRDNAFAVRLGSFGEKKDPIGAKARLEVEGNVKADYLDGRVLNNLNIDIDWAKNSKTDVEVNGALKFFGIKGGTAMNGSYEKAKSAKLKLINFTINEGPLKKMLNNDANAARNYLKDEGSDGRIVSEIWVVTEAELAENFDSASSIQVSVSKGSNNIEIKADHGANGSSTIELNEGSVFAYRMHKVKDWNKGKTEIEDMETDWKGMG